MAGAARFQSKATLPITEGDAKKKKKKEPRKGLPWSIQIFLTENWDALLEAEKTTPVLCLKPPSFRLYECSVCEYLTWAGRQKVFPKPVIYSNKTEGAFVYP